MKAILAFALAQFKRFMRDPVYLFFMFAFPLIFLFIFGSIFGGNSNLTVEVALLDNSKTPFGQTLATQLREATDTPLAINPEITDLDEAKTKMSRSEIYGIIELPLGFGATAPESCDPSTTTCATTTAPSGELKLYYDKASPEIGQTITVIIKGVIDSVNSQITGVTPPLTVTQVSTDTTGLTQFDYIFAGLFAYVLMTMGIYTLSQQLPSEKKTGALRRIKATPFKPWQLITSLALVYLVLTLLSAALMMTVSIVAFNFQMRGNWLVLLIVSIISALTLIGFGAIVTAAARNENQATIASQLIAFPMMFLSGVFFPRFVMPEFLQNATSWLPLTHINDAVRHITTEGATLIDVLPQITAISLWGIAAYIIAIKIFKWE
jgi:ABC-2 type transport system permease protein